MTANAIVAQVIDVLRKVALVLILVSLALILLRAFGVVIPIRSGLSEVALAYCAGVYWLTK